MTIEARPSGFSAADWTADHQLDSDAQTAWQFQPVRARKTAAIARAVAEPMPLTFCKSDGSASATACYVPK